MSRIAYVNGSYLPHNQASVHIEDRGYQFSDGVYEVIALMKGHLIDAKPHYERLQRSLTELQIESPLSQEGLRHVVQEIIRLNRLKDGMIYMQITRGVAPRYHPFPKNSKPSLVVTASYFDFDSFRKAKNIGVKLISLPDKRWGRPDIKSISLLPNVLGKQKAVEEGAYEAALINKDGFVTEANATNIWAVDKTGALRTHPADLSILNGITRLRLIELAQQRGISVIESPFTLKELLEMEEVFLSSSVAGIIPVIQIDETYIGNQEMGQITRQIQQDYLIFCEESMNHD